MRHLKVIAAVAAVGMAVAGYAVVQTHHQMSFGHANPAQMVDHLSKAFAQFATFDADKNGVLDAREKEALAKALADGSLTLPAPAPSKEMFGSDEARLDHFAEMYAKFAAFDANHDGELDATEQAAVRTAI